MSGGGGNDSEMLRRLMSDDETSEAILSGRTPAGGELAGLVSFVEDARAAGRSRMPIPGPALEAMFVDGVSAENGDLLVTAASNVHGPATQAAGLPKRRNKKMTVAELLAGLGIGAKAALGIGVAAAAVTGAAAAGVLPDAAQHSVASTVNAVSPFPDLPDSTNGNADFGKKVSADATGTSDDTKGVDGKTVSGDAAQKGLTTANSTPAAGHVPTSVPNGSSDPGLGNVPTSLPPTTTVTPGEPSSSGTGVASGTPAEGHVPTSVPPAGRP
jgi:hypothetical protein